MSKNYREYVHCKRQLNRRGLVDSMWVIRREATFQTPA